MNKSGFNYLDHWAELMMMGLLFIGLVVSLLADSALVNYVIILLSGVLVGRLYGMRRSQMSVPFYLIVIGYLAGFLIGASFIKHRGEIIVLLLFFAIGCYFGNDLVKRKLIK